MFNPGGTWTNDVWQRSKRSLLTMMLTITGVRFYSRQYVIHPILVLIITMKSNIPIICLSKDYQSQTALRLSRDPPIQTTPYPVSTSYEIIYQYQVTQGS